MENNSKQDGENLIEIDYRPYVKRKYFFSVAELKFFELLKEIIGENYYIFPKVRICDIIQAKDKSSYSDFNKIKSKHVDYLICTKEPITAKIVVELDDKSHNSNARQIRDSFVDDIFANSGIPIVHIKVQYSYKKEDLIKKIQKAYRTKYVIKKKVENQNKSTGCGLLVIIVIAITTTIFL